MKIASTLKVLTWSFLELLGHCVFFDSVHVFQVSEATALPFLKNEVKFKCVRLVLEGLDTVENEWNWFRELKASLKALKIKY